MKIAYLAHVRLPTYKAHGIQILKTCEAFAKKGADVTLYVPAKRHTVGGTEDPFDYYGVGRSFSVTRIPASDLLGMTRLFGRLFYLLDLLSFIRALGRLTLPRDAVIYTRDPALLSPFFGSGRKLVLELHEIPANPWFIPFAKRADRIVALTKALRDDLIELGLSEERIIVAGDAIDPRDFIHPESKEAARERLGLPHDARVALYVGRLDGWKGLETVYAAAPLLKSVVFAVIGGEEPALSTLKDAHPSVRFLGARPYRELKDNMAAADVLILPNTGRNRTSARHTSPLKLFAYMTSGRPIVASDLLSVREALPENAAYYVVPDSAEALANGIRDALENPDESRAKADRAEAAVRAHSWDARAERILASIT